MYKPNLDDLMQVPRFVKRYPDLTSENHIRWLIFKRDLNGLNSSGAIIKRAGRWYVNIPRFRAWLLATEE